MEERHGQLADAELHPFFDRMFPHGVAGADVLAELAPDGWERSPLLACFHPTVEQLFEEARRLRRNLRSFSRDEPRRDGDSRGDDVSSSEPTLDAIRREHQPAIVQPHEELTALVGLCLWDLFSDNHDVIAADGRAVDIGSFRGAGAFLDEHVTPARGREYVGDYMRFHLGTRWIAHRADLTPVYVMIFRRLRACGAEWRYYFPGLSLTEIGPSNADAGSPAVSSTSDAASTEQGARRSRVGMARLREEIAAADARAREEALDRLPPATVRAYREVYGRDPRGWPPA